jgi:hypothetical protein
LNDVPAFNNPSSTKDFLRDDLRIDQEDWGRIDVKKLLRLNQHYKSQTIARIMEVL